MEGETKIAGLRRHSATQWRLHVPDRKQAILITASALDVACCQAERLVEQRRSE